MAQWHFQKGGTAATCQHGMQNTRVDAKRDGSSPPGDWRCSGNVIQRSSAMWESWRTLSRVGKWRQSLKMRGNLAEKEEEPLWQWMVLGISASVIADWWLRPWDFPYGSSLGVSGIGCSAWCLVSDLWSLTIVDLVSVIQTTRSGVKSVTSFFCLSHLFKPLYMNDSS